MRRPIVAVLTSLAIVAGTVWYLSAMTIRWGESSSVVRTRWNEMFMQVTWIAIVVAVLVWGLLLYALWRFRAKPGEFKEGPHIHGNTRMEIAWTIAPAAVMGWLLLISYNGLSWVDDHPEYPNDFVIEVTGSQFTWEFKYPDGTTSINNTLFVEVNKNVGLNITSRDVIHAFSVHDLAVMKDAIPGRTNYDWFRATRADNYTIKCRELCGAGHSEMVGTVVVLPAGEAGPNGYGWKGMGVIAPSPSPAPAVTTTGPAGNNTTTPLAAGRVIPIKLAPGGVFTIDPKELTIGLETITFEVQNSDRLVHNFFVGTFDKSQPNHGAIVKTGDLAGGGSESVTFKFDKDATYEFWCDIGGHRTGPKQGMSGEMTVGKGGGGLAKDDLLLPGPDPAWLLAALAVGVLVLRRRA